MLLLRPEPAAIIAAVSEQRATLLSVVPTVLSNLLALPDVGALRSLRAVLVGGAATPDPLYRELGGGAVRVADLRSDGSLLAGVHRALCRAATVPGGIRVPLPGLDVVIGSDDDSAAAGDERGEITATPPGTPGADLSARADADVGLSAPACTCRALL